MAAQAGATVIELMTGLTKFYGHIELALMVPLACQLEYPGVPLCMALTMHRDGGSVRRHFGPERSLLAGCGQSVDLARRFLYDLLTVQHNRWAFAPVWSWVDDLPLQAIGSRKHIEEKGDEAIKSLFKGLEAKGLIVSKKTVRLCSDDQTGKAVQKQLKGEGYEIDLVKAARDLGLDATLGGGGAKTPHGKEGQRSKKDWPG